MKKHLLGLPMIGIVECAGLAIYVAGRIIWPSVETVITPYSASLPAQKRNLPAPTVFFASPCNDIDTSFICAP